MIGAISSGAVDLIGTLAAIANPRTLNGQLNGARVAAGGSTSTTKVEAANGTAAAGCKCELTEEELKQVEELEKRDAEVRRHEQAHKAAAGQYARGGPTFEYETGPDGRQYAVGGEVNIETSEVEGDPQATIRKMQAIRLAANAPAEPSSKDRQVAAKAAQLEAKARAELAQQRAQGESESGLGDSPVKSTAPGQFIDVRV